MAGKFAKRGSRRFVSWLVQQKRRLRKITLYHQGQMLTYNGRRLTMPEYLKEFPFYPAIAGETPITLDTFVSLVVLEVPGEAPVGEYVGMLSLIAANPDINDSLIFRITSSTGFVSQEFSIEPKDISNVVPWSYSFYLPRVTKDLPFTLTVEARKQDPQANDILIETTNLLLKREG